MPRCHLEGAVPGVKGHSSSKIQEEILSPHPPPFLVLPRAPAGRTPQQPEALGAHSLVQGGQLRNRGQDEDCAQDVGRHAGPHDRRLCSETNGLKMRSSAVTECKQTLHPQRLCGVSLRDSPSWSGWPPTLTSLLQSGNLKTYGNTHLHLSKPVCVAALPDSPYH